MGDGESEGKEGLPDAKPRVSIIIINFNGTSNLFRNIESILSSGYDNFEIIVVDCLTPSLEEKLRERFGDPRIRVVHFERDIGAAASHNVGALVSDPKSKYLVFMDDDIVVTPGWLDRLVEVMESEPHVGVAQAKLVSMREKGKMDHLGLALDALGTWYTAYGMDEGEFTRPMYVFAASSATLITRRDLYFEAGGFDWDYFIYDDDTDYSWRVRLLGYEVRFVPEAVVYHKGGLVGGLRQDKLFYGFRNRLTNLIKNLDTWSLLLQLPLTLFFGFANILFLAVTGSYRETSAYALATLDVMRNWRRIAAKRGHVQSTRRVGDGELRRRGFLRRSIYATVHMSRLLAIEYVKNHPKLRVLYERFTGKD